MVLQPYLSFAGRCDEAIEFYRSVLKAEVQMLMRFKESPEPHPSGMLPPGYENKVMHMSLKVGDSVLMGSDGCATEGPEFKGFSLSLTADSDAEAERIFAALSQGGTVQMPLGKTFFASRFGMVQDRFGISWMVLAMPMGAP